MSEPARPAMTPQQAFLGDAEQGAFSMYRALAVGDTSLAAFLYYEFCTTLFSNLPGLVGFGARAFCYPALFAHCATRPVFGRGVLIRNPARISIGKKVLVDDYAVLDVRPNDSSIALADHVCIGRFTTVAAKGGHVAISAGVNIGSYCRIATQSKITIGESTLIAAYVYIGPGNHQQGDGEAPLITREMEIKGGVVIGAHAWIGAHTTILDGVTIGERAIVGAHSLVREDVPAGAIVAGSPARIIKQTS